MAKDVTGEINTDIAALVDIRDIEIDGNLPTEERVREFVRQVKDPYHFRVGAVAVRVSYTNESSTLNDNITAMISSL